MACDCLCMGPRNCQNLPSHISVSVNCFKGNFKFYEVQTRRRSLKLILNGDSPSIFHKRNRVMFYSSRRPSVSVSFQRSKTLVDHLYTSINHMDDFERGLDELFNEVKSMIVNGEKDAAADLLKANYEAVKEQMDAGDAGIEQAAILDVIALGYIGLGDFKFVSHLMELLQALVDHLQDGEPLLDSILIHMGSVYNSLGKFNEAVLVYERSLQLLEKLFGNDNPFLVTPILGMAKAFGFIGKAIKAIEMYKLAISILEMRRGAECEDLVVPLSALANLLIKEEKVAEAESSFKRVLSIHTKLYGDYDGRTGLAMCSLAHALSAKGDVNGAILQYTKGLQIIKDSKYMDLEDGFLEKMKVDLAELLHVAGREHEGRKLLEECLLTTERHKGSEHSSYVTHLLNLTSSYSRSKNFVEAERLLRTSLRILKSAINPDDPSLSLPMLHLAVTLYNLKQDEEAENLALEVVKIREAAFGKQSLPVGEALDCLASIQIRLEKDDNEILTLLKRVLDIQEAEFGNESEEVMATLKKITFYLDKLGQKDEKLLLQKRLSHLRRLYKQRMV